MLIQNDNLGFSVKDKSIEELLGLSLDTSLNFDVFTSRFNNTGSIQTIALNTNYYYDFTLGLELFLERATLGVVDILYPVGVELELPEMVSANDNFFVGTTDNFQVSGASITGESLNFGEAGINLTFQSAGAGLTDISFGNVFGQELLPLENDLIFGPIQPIDPITLAKVSAGASQEDEVLDGVTLIRKSPTGEEKTSLEISGSSGELVPVSVNIEDPFLSVSINPLEVFDFGPLKALDVLTENFGPVKFGKGYEAEFEYVLAAPKIAGGYGLVQSFSFNPSNIKTTINIGNQSFSGFIGDDFEFLAPQNLTEPLNGNVTYELNGSVDVSYALAPIGKIGVDILSAKGSIGEINEPAVNVDIGPVFETSISGSSSFGRIQLFDPISIELPSGFFEPIVQEFAIPVEGITSLSFVQDFVTGSTQDTQVVFDIERLGDTTFPITIFVDGEVTTGNAVFNDFSYTLPAGDSPQLIIGASVSEVFGDVAFNFEIDAINPDSSVVNIIDGTAAGILFGDRIDNRGGQAFGDPHLITFDNVSYDFQAAGDFILTRATSGSDYEVQARFSAFSSAVSVTTAMATKVDGIAVSIQIDGDTGDLLIDGSSVNIIDGDSIAVGGGSISRNGRKIEIDHGNGDKTLVDVFSSFMNVTPSPSLARVPGSLEGLLGDADGNPGDDFQLADGTVLSTPLPISTLYGSYAASWLVADNESILPGARELFDAPDRIITIDSLPQSLRQAAEAAVAAAGITNPILREAAILDFALTGNVEFIEAAKLTNDIFDPIIDTVAVDPIKNPVVILTTNRIELDEANPAHQTATLTVSRGSTEGNLTINYDVNGVGAYPANTDDFSGNTSGTVIINDGEDTATFTVGIVDDLLDEESEQFDVAIALDGTQASAYELLVSSVRMTILDDDDGPVLNEVTGTTTSDYLVGTGNADIIHSLGGSYDKSVGGLGADVFAFGAEALNGVRERDVILDYEVGVDAIMLTDGATIGSIRQTSTGAVIFLEGDLDAIYVQGEGVLTGNLTFVSENILFA